LAVEAETKRHQEAANQAEAARWKPTVKVLSTVQGSAQVNLLRLESLQEFALLEAGLLSSSGAKIADYLVNGPKVRSTGFSVPITHETLVKSRIPASRTSRRAASTRRSGSLCSVRDIPERTRLTFRFMPK